VCNEALAGFVGTQSLSPFPEYRMVRSAARVIGDITAAHFPPPDASTEYPIVGIIDTGTDPNNTYLQAWVADRFDIVPRSEQNHAHGSFVAAIIAGGRALNHNDPRFPETPCMIIDVVALDKSGTVNEMDLLDAIDKSLAVQIVLRFEGEVGTISQITGSGESKVLNAPCGVSEPETPQTPGEASRRQ
jgi:subtilase family protein